ncbi:MAG: response regulator [Eubacterium sp.]|nr:response regulator [Eubacterium sp.]
MIFRGGVVFLDKEHKQTSVAAYVVAGLIVIVIMVFGTIFMGQRASTDTERAVKKVSLLYLDRADAKEVPIIALTANAFDEDVQRSLQAGMNAHLSKPVQPDVLYETLESQYSHGLAEAR